MSAAIDKVRAAVAAEAEAEAARIISEAGDALKKRLAEAEAEAAKQARKRLEAARAKLEEDNRRAVSQASRQARLENLQARNRVLDAIFSRVRKKALSLPPGEYRKILKRWVDEIGPSGGGEILPAPRDRETLKEIIGELNPRRAKGEELRLSSDDAPLENGFVFRTATYEISRSLEGWLQERRRDLAPALEKKIFGPEDR